MAVTITADPAATAVLEKIARADVQHPVDQTSVFVCGPLLLTLSMGTNGSTPTVAISPSGTHKWPYEAEPTLSFDDRTLGP